MSVSLDEAEMGVALPSAPDHGSRKVYTNAHRRLQCSQQVTLATAKLKHPLLRCDQKLIECSEPPVIKAAPTAPAVRLLGNLIPVRYAHLLMGSTGSPGRIVDCHRHRM